MKQHLVDSNVLLDLFLDDPTWADWSERQLTHCSSVGVLYINPIIYAEVSIGFDQIEQFEKALAHASLVMMVPPREALFLAGKAFLSYRRNQGTKTSPLPDFFIGAHAAVMDMTLITRDAARYRTYFPTVPLITP